MSLRDLSVRTLAGGGLTAAILASVLLSNVAFIALMSLIVAVGVWEFFELARRKGARPNAPLGIFLALCLLCGMALHVRMGERGASPGVLLGLLLLILFTARLFRRSSASPLLDLSAELAGIAYVAGLGSFPILLRNYRPISHPTDAVHLTALVFITIWAADTFAYLIGSGLGRHKLWPRVSPGKSVEGVAGGFLGALIATLWGVRVLDFLSVGEAAILTFLVIIAGVIGDLVESALKRDAGVKDASRIIPGHGGVLDRFDSCLFVFPAVYAYVSLFDVF